MKRILTAFAIAFGVSSAAQAGILIEPYLGYEFGDVKYEFVSSTPLVGGNSYTDKVSGVGYGLRLGYKFMIPWIALDYTGSSGKSKNELFNEDYDYTRTSLGAVVGANLPLIRLWAGYGFSNEIKIKDTTDTSFKGTYTKVGVGFGPIPFLSINAEYIMNTFNKYTSSGTEVDASDVFSSLKNDMIMLSVSAPFNL